MKVILISFLLFGVAWAALNCECGKRNAGRIVGGKVAKKNEFPWMVALANATTKFTNCGGSILTPWHIVTAGHCVYDYTLPGHSIQELSLSVGAHDVNDASDVTRQDLIPAQIILHPKYVWPTVNDVAIVIPTTQIIYNEVVVPICMPIGLTDDKLVGQMIKVMGWGRYDWRRPNTDKIKKLREVDLEIQSCSSSDSTKMCTWSAGKDSCRGDSGGPIAWLDPDTNRFTIVGVVSYGPENCGESSMQGINSNVLYYDDWINQTIGSTSSNLKDVSTCHKV